MNQVIADLTVRIAYYLLIAYAIKSIKEVVMMWLAGGNSLTTIFPPRTNEAENGIDLARRNGLGGYVNRQSVIEPEVIGDPPEVREINVH